MITYMASSSSATSKLAPAEQQSSKASNISKRVQGQFTACLQQWYAGGRSMLAVMVCLQQRYACT